MPEPEVRKPIAPPKVLLVKYADFEPVPLDKVLDIVVSYIEITSYCYRIKDNNNALVDYINKSLGSN